MMLESHQSYEFELDDNVSESERGGLGRGGDRVEICYSC